MTPGFVFCGSSGVQRLPCSADQRCNHFERALRANGFSTDAPSGTMQRIGHQWWQSLAGHCVIIAGQSAVGM